jgi:cell wall-associated NlpC family hydrolase
MSNEPGQTQWRNTTSCNLYAGYDCSGLTRWAYYKAFGADVNDGATGTQVRAGDPIACMRYLVWDHHPEINCVLMHHAMPLNAHMRSAYLAQLCTAFAASHKATMVIRLARCTCKPHR